MLRGDGPPDATPFELEPAVLDALIRLGARDGKLIDPNLLARTVGKEVTAENLHALNALCDALASKKTPLSSYLSGEKIKLGGGVTDAFERMFAAARAAVDNPKRSLVERLAAVRVMGRGMTEQADDVRRLERMLKPETPDELQQAILNQLIKIGDEKTPARLIVAWKSFTPALRAQAFDTLSARKNWVYHVLLSVESNKILPGELDAARAAVAVDEVNVAAQRRLRAGACAAPVGTGRRVSCFTSLSTMLERTCVTPGRRNSVSCWNCS